MRTSSPSARMLGCAFVVRRGRSVMGSCRRCRSSTVVAWSLSVLPCRALSYLGGGFHLALRARARTGRALGAPPVPSPLVGSRGPPVPCFASAARYARARQGSGGLRQSGSARGAPFLSADAIRRVGRWALWRLVRFDYFTAHGVGRFLSCRAVALPLPSHGAVRGSATSLQEAP